MRMRTAFAVVLTASAIAIGSVHPRAQSNQNIGTAVKTSAQGIHILKVRDDVYMLTGAGGNEKLSASGRRLPHDIIGADNASGGAEGPVIVAHENVSIRMSAPTGNQAPYPVRAWPTDPYHFPIQKLSAHLRGGEAVELQ